MKTDQLPVLSNSPTLSRGQKLHASRIVVFEANAVVAAFIQKSLTSYCNVQVCASEGELPSTLLQSGPLALVIFGWVGGSAALACLLSIRRMQPKVPILLLCRDFEQQMREELAGLANLSVLMKPFTADELRAAVFPLLRPSAAAVNLVKESVLDSAHSFVRASPAMHEVERQAALVAASEIPVLILGESGTGKEILATFVHTMSRRKANTFMKINCAAMPAELLESELFGYEQGAFTGANRTKPGKFEVCNGGTIFLDEIGEMPANLQAKLLQVLQDGTYSRLGGRSAMKTNVRVISATNVALKKAIAEGAFREDLYYRLNGISIKLPPLRNRKEEIPALLKHFQEKGARRFGLEPVSISPVLRDALMRHEWPGNLRELENLMNRLLVLRDENSVLSELCDVQSIQSQKFGEQQESMARRTSARNVPDKETIVRTLEKNRWNRRATADDLQMNYKTLLSKIRVYELGESSQ